MVRSRRNGLAPGLLAAGPYRAGVSHSGSWVMWSGDAATSLAVAISVGYGGLACGSRLMLRGEEREMDTRAEGSVARSDRSDGKERLQRRVGEAIM